jgi:hypothetical protein
MPRAAMSLIKFPLDVSCNLNIQGSMMRPMIQRAMGVRFKSEEKLLRLVVY